MNAVLSFLDLELVPLIDDDDDVLDVLLVDVLFAFGFRLAVVVVVVDCFGFALLPVVVDDDDGKTVDIDVVDCWPLSKQSCLPSTNV